MPDGRRNRPAARGSSDNNIGTVMAAASDDIVFIIPGQSQPNAPAIVPGVVKASVRVGAQRGGGDSVRVTARAGEDMVVLSIANGPTLVLHPAHARDLMLSQDATPKRSGKDDPPPGSVTVPPQLAWPGLEGVTTRSATRGWLGQVLLQAVQIVTGPMEDQAADFTAAVVTKRLDEQVRPGVYRLSADALPRLKDSGQAPQARIEAIGDKPLLVFLHGTFVDSASTFSKLWAQHPALVGQLFDAYAHNVFALDHPTVGTSPIGNALALAQALPEGARLHLVTHSRGGLVAEVLARACSGVSAADLALFADRPDADYQRHRDELQALAALLKARQVKVERVVRVACPARGTLLASTRLDAYLSVLKWGLELAHVPVLPELVDFIAAVAQRRADPSRLPGIEAMMATSPVVAWLNSAGELLPGQLRVVAGDIDGDSVTAWVKTLLADAFYWTDNDLVVQTRSMYGGTPRANEGASFLLDRGGQVTHFDYFGNQRTAQAVSDALLNDTPAGFRLIGPLSWGGGDASGTRGGRAVERSRQTRDGVPASGRPAAVVLPGILGSNLKRDGSRVWLGLRFINGLKQLAWDPAQPDNILDDGPIGRVYDDLMDHLADTHEVIPFGYDWRRPLEDEAKRLAARVQAALDEREASAQPVRLVAHSMGGLLARTLQLVAPEVWQRLLARDGARVLMLGTPNGGSWAPMQTLSGDDSFGNALAAFGALFDNQGSRRVMAGMPGFLQLQAGLLDPDLALDKSQTWQQLADDDERRLRQHNAWHDQEPQIAVYEWSAPPQPVLDAAVALRRRLDAQIDKLGADRQKMLLVVGRAPFTPAGMQMGEQGLVYLDAKDGGDGRVTLASATQLGLKTWQAEAEHGSLPSLRSAFEAYAELLQTGTTTRLPALEAASGTRGGPGGPTPVPLLLPNRPSRGSQPSQPPSTEMDLYGNAPAADTGGAAQALPVTVLNGNLKFVAMPLLLGHYMTQQLSGAEAVVDPLIGGGMSQSLKAGLYPGPVGTHQVFVNNRVDPNQPLAMPRPSLAIIVGLGEEGSLRMSALTHGVRQAVIACAQHQRDAAGPAGFELASTLVGSGGSGVSPGAAAQALALGVRAANEQLQLVGWPQVTRLHLVELYLDRATEAQRAIAVLSDANPNGFRLTPSVVPGTGPLRRPLESSYRGAGYDFVSAVQRFDERHNPVIEYTLDTQRARSEVRGQATQSQLVDELVKVGADSDSTDTKIRRSLFQLLVPVEIEPFLAGSTTMLLQLDSATARFPWELLDAGKRDGRDVYPWAVRTRLLRKLRTETFREHPVNTGPDGGVLVIGEPQADPARFGPLPAAQEEARVVAKALGAQPLLGPDALGVVKALLAEPLRLVHIAGHGELLDDGSGGVVLSNNMRLGASEIHAMRSMPELVFINCCFIGQIKPEAETPRAPGASRARFAASVAEELIRIGVRCVVAAGWAVEDDPAMRFAKTFYEQLLGGQRFIDAIGLARRAAYDARPEGNTWAAYQCYGDPDWRYAAAPESIDRAEPEAAIVSAPALALALETVALEAQYADGGGDPARKQQLAKQRLQRVRGLERRHAAQWGGIGAVAEAFGLAYAQTGQRDDAIRWYQRAVAAPDGSASFKSAEQLGNLLARRGGANASIDAGAKDIAEAIAQLDRLVAIQPSAERYSLLGSAWKLRAALETRRLQGAAAGDAKAARAALARAAGYYADAEAAMHATGAADLFYPAMNAIACELRLAFLDGRAPLLQAARLLEVRQSLQAKASADPDFWALAGTSELALMEALAQARLADAAPAILAGLQDLKARVDAAWMWDSVLTQARFIVEPYRDHAAAGAAEKRAAATWLDEIARLAKA